MMSNVYGPFYQKNIDRRTAFQQGRKKDKPKALQARDGRRRCNGAFGRNPNKDLRDLLGFGTANYVSQKKHFDKVPEQAK